MADEFDKLVPDFLALARRIFDAGRLAERTQIGEAILKGAGALVADATVVRAVRPGARRESASYGAVSGPVRDVLKQLSAQHPEGVGAGDIDRFFREVGNGPDLRQIRAALKTLNIAGEAIRADRGRYLSRDAAPAQPSGENPEAGTSGLFGLAAE